MTGAVVDLVKGMQMAGGPVHAELALGDPRGGMRSRIQSASADVLLAHVFRQVHELGLSPQNRLANLKAGTQKK